MKMHTGTGLPVPVNATLCLGKPPCLSTFGGGDDDDADDDAYVDGDGGAMLLTCLCFIKAGCGVPWCDDVVFAKITRVGSGSCFERNLIVFGSLIVAGF